ncbi:hypothetical protein KKB28_08640 [bacterium]|nr:hypothetical protein [bacterium]
MCKIHVPMVGRLLCSLLALGVVLMARPAGGFVLLEQRSESELVPLPNENSTEVKMDLSGEWKWRLNRDETWQTGWIPSCFDDVPEDVIFRREFLLPDSLRGWHFHLIFPQVNYKISIEVNGKFIESIEGNHLGFNLDLPSQLLRFREPNIIELRVNTHLSPKTTLPLFPQIFSPRNYGGLPDGCSLWITPPWTIEEVLLKWPVPDSSVGAELIVNISRAFLQTLPFSAPFSTMECSGKIIIGEKNILSQSDRIAFSAEGEQTQKLTLKFPPFTPQTWSPDSPVLYTLEVRIETPEELIHLYCKTVGFKDFSLSDGRFYLNGNEIFLRGTQYVPQQIETGIAISKDFFEADIQRMKELGFNLLHVIPSPPPPALLDACDSLGMLVFAGLSLEGVPADILSKPSYREQCNYGVRRLVVRDRGHVSVAAWGLGHDLDWKSEKTRKVIQEMSRTLRTLDSRPAFLETYRLVDAANYPVDFFLLGLAPWRRNFPLDPQMATKPIILSRVGMMVKETGKDGEQAAGSVQADFLLGQINQTMQDSIFGGFLLFTFSDYQGQIPLLAREKKKEPFLYPFGLVDMARQERVSFYKLRDLAQTGESSPMSQSSSKESLPIEFPIVGLGLIVLFSLEIRRNNVFKQNLKRAFLHAHGFFSDIHARRFLQSSQTLILILIQAICWALLFSSLFYGLRASYRFDYLLTHFIRWPSVKLSFLDLVWNPVPGMVKLTLLFFLFFIIAAVKIKFFAILFRTRVSFGKAITYFTWSGANFIFLLPFAVVFNRLVEIPQMATPSAIIILIFVFWFWLRLFNALRVAYNTSYPRLYFATLGGGITAALIVAVLLQASIGTLSFWTYYWNVLMKG